MRRPRVVFQTDYLIVGAKLGIENTEAFTMSDKTVHKRAKQAETVVSVDDFMPQLTPEAFSRLAREPKRPEDDALEARIIERARTGKLR